MLKRLFGKNEPQTSPAPVATAPVPPISQDHDGPAILGVAVSGNSAFVTTTSSLIGLDLATGREQFRFRSELPPMGPPTTDGSSVFYLGLVDTYCQIVTVDADSGVERWRSDTGQMLTPDRTTIAYSHGGLLWVPSLVGPMTIDAKTGKVESVLSADANVIPWGIRGCQHAIERGIYPVRLGHGGFAGFGLADRQPRWVVEQQLCPSAPPIVTRSGRMFTFGRDGRFACTEVESGRGVLRIDSDDACPASGDIAAEATERLLFVAVAGALTAYDVIDLDYAWDQEIEHSNSIVLGLSGDGETLLTSGQENFIFALDAASGGIRWAGQCPGAAAAKDFVPVTHDRFLVSTTNRANDGSTVASSLSLREIDRGLPVWEFAFDD